MGLLDEIKNVLDRIPGDFGGGSPLEKVYLMGHLAATRRPQTYVEIGVYRGRSLFPVAVAMRSHGGKAYGIDPYSKEQAHEDDIPPHLAEALQEFLEQTDFEQIHRDVIGLVQELGLGATVEILRVPAEQAVGQLQDRRIPIGMLHIDGNHDTRLVMRDVELYLPLVVPDGIVVMDDIDWDSVKPAYAKVKERMTVLFEAPTFSILVNRPDEAELDPLKEGLALMHEALAQRTSDKDPVVEPKVSVSITTYNQERYIAAAIESAVAQRTRFPFEIVIADDCSTDRTGEIVEQYRRKYPKLIRRLPRERNLGAVPNYLETFKACRGEYVAFLEGDDFWIKTDKLQKQVEFLEANKDFAICCHNVIVVDENGDPQRTLLRNVPAESTVENLCQGDYISTPSCMVRNGLLKELPGWIYSLEGCDWVLDILHAEKGRIRYFDEPMAAYRVHKEGIWSKYDELGKLRSALQVSQTINRCLDYRYAKQFQVNQQFIRHEIKRLQEESTTESPAVVITTSNEVLIREYEIAMSELEKARGLHKAGKRELRALKRSHRELKTKYKQARRIIASAEAWQRRSWVTRALHRWRPRGGGAKLEKPPKDHSPVEPPQTALPAPAEVQPVKHVRGSGLVILDDIFPHPLSAFRYEEYCSYLKSIPEAVVYCTASAFGFLKEKRTLEEMVSLAEARAPWLKGRVKRFDFGPPLGAALAYFIFLGNAVFFLDKLEKDQVPFVFTLYPGGYFELNDSARDGLMRRVFSSPMFRRVIVTQNITRDYLLEHDFCAPQQIVYIQGVVTPSEHLHRNLEGKTHYGFGKPRLDICFVAHKYSDDGVDKGYDVFIETAKVLAARHENIFFHVVGGFNQSVMDVGALGERISFYGNQESDWFEKFYQDKDIVLSPNIPFILAPGAFDGFPTGCCTDAALHAVAMFCTDVLKLNENFTDGTDIVLIPHNVGHIVETIDHYHQHPAELRSIAEKGCETSRRVYSYENQVAPRLRILQELIRDESHA